MNLVAEPLIPFALWVTLAMVAVVIWLWYVRQPKTSAGRWRLISCSMGLSLALPLVVLLNLTWIEPARPPAGKPRLNIVLDTSQSMETKDVAGESRLSQARRIVQQLSVELESSFDVFHWTFAGQCLPADDQLNVHGGLADRSTDLAGALTASSWDDSPQGQAIMVLSDGIHNRSSSHAVIEAAQRLQTQNIPVYTYTLGGDTMLINASVALKTPQEIAFVGQEISIAAEVQSSGLAGQTTRLSLWHEEQQIAQQDLTLDRSGKNTALFPLRSEHSGLDRYEIRLSSMEGEATIDDNRATLMVRTVDRPIKMLLVEGKPYWDTKFLFRNLVADRSIELTSVVRMADQRYLKRRAIRTLDAPVSEGSALPSGNAIESTELLSAVDDVLSEAALADVQIVLLGRSAEVYLTEQSLEALRNWISQTGGSLICVRGAPSSQISQRLGQILPVAWTPDRESRFRVSLTGEGRELRWLASSQLIDQPLESMPSLATLSQPKTRPGLTRVLAATERDGEPIPVVSFQPYGMGRTVVVEGAGMWRWALLPPEHSARETLYAEVWRGLLRWMSSRTGLQPGQNVALQSDRVSFSTGDEMSATLLVRGDYAQRLPYILLESDKLEPMRINPLPRGDDLGAYLVEFPELLPGVYTAKAIDGETVLATTAFDVRDPWVESLDLNSRPELMARVARETGGAVLEEATPTELKTWFADYQAKSNSRPIQRTTFWDRWWWLVAAFGLWAGTWAARRQSGLV